MTLSYKCDKNQELYHADVIKLRNVPLIPHLYCNKILLAFNGQHYTKTETRENYTLNEKSVSR